jgi:hypothetical protein
MLVVPGEQVHACAEQCFLFSQQPIVHFEERGSVHTFNREELMATLRRAEERVDRGFWIHLAAYVTVVGSLAVMNFMRNPDRPWVLWVAGGWGIGIAVHAVMYSTRRQKMIERVDARMEKREARQERRQDAMRDTDIL